MILYDKVYCFGKNWEYLCCRDGIVRIFDVRAKSGRSAGRTNVWWVSQGGRMLHKVTQDMENEIDYSITMWFKNGDAK